MMRILPTLQQQPSAPVMPQSIPYAPAQGLPAGYQAAMMASPFDDAKMKRGGGIFGNNPFSTPATDPATGAPATAAIDPATGAAMQSPSFSDAISKLLMGG